MHLQQAPGQITNLVKITVEADRPPRINRQNILMQQTAGTENTLWVGAEAGMALLSVRLEPGRIQAIKRDRLLARPNDANAEKLESSLGRLVLVSNNTELEQELLVQARQGTVLVKIEQGDSLQAATDSLLAMAPEMGQQAVTKMASQPGAYVALEPGTYLLEPAA